MNEAIRIRQVRLIDDEGNQIGVVDTDHARRIAQEKGLDLVEVSPDARPPVCKVMDYGKFKYDQKKKEHDSRKKQHKIQIKEIRLRPKIGQHDIEYKSKRARQFLEEGHKVQLNMLFRGREMAHIDVGRAVLLKFAEQLSDLSKVERAPKMEGRRLTMLLLSTAPPIQKKEPKEARESKESKQGKESKEKQEPKAASSSASPPSTGT